MRACRATRTVLDLHLRGRDPIACLNVACIDAFVRAVACEVGAAMLVATAADATV